MSFENVRDAEVPAWPCIWIMQAVTNACKKYGGFYLGSIGGPAAILAQNNIKKVIMGSGEVYNFTALLLMHACKLIEELYPINCLL